MDNGPKSLGATPPLSARTLKGYSLPVLDLTHDAFRIEDTAASRTRMDAELVEHERRLARLPSFLLRLLLKSEAKRSRLVSAMFADNRTVLDGITTYVMKLGSENLVQPFDTPADRRFAAAPPVAFMRLRTLQTASLLASAIRRELETAGNAPLELINIAGGPAMDSLNALVFVAQDAPALLKRPITIRVLDSDRAGPYFGSNALRQMISSGPLRGLCIRFEHTSYDWSYAAGLVRLVGDLASGGAVVIASSEGGLFEYGSDAAITANLLALHAGGHGAKAVVGSVTRSRTDRGRSGVGVSLHVVPRGLEVFRPLASDAGFQIAEARPALWSDQIELLPL